MAKRRFKVEVTLSATYEIVADDEIFNENLADGISKGWHEIDYDEDKPAIQALVEDVAGMYLQTGGDGERMEPYGEIVEEGNQYQEEMPLKKNRRTVVVSPLRNTVMIIWR